MGASVYARVAKKLHTWRIYRIRKTPAEYLGSIEAPDKKAAEDKWAAEHKITDPERRRRLMAVQEV